MRLIAFSQLDELLLMHKRVSADFNSTSLRCAVELTVYQVKEDDFILKLQKIPRREWEDREAPEYYRGTRAERNKKMKEIGIDPNFPRWVVG